MPLIITLSLITVWFSISRTFFPWLARGCKYYHYRYCTKDYDKLFLITDEIQTLELFRERYGQELIHYDNASLSSNGQGIHRGGSEESKYKLGEDVVLEAELMSKVDYLLAMNSNLSLWAILRQDKGYSFIDKGIEYK